MQTYPGFELRLPCPFSTTINITLKEYKHRQIIAVNLKNAGNGSYST